MGGHGVGASPEDLLVSAISSCYVATFFGVLRSRRLVVDSVAVSASGTVTGFPGHAGFARIMVNPTVVGGDGARRAEYEAAAVVAHDRCFIGRALAPEVITKSVRSSCSRIPRLYRRTTPTCRRTGSISTVPTDRSLGERTRGRVWRPIALPPN